MSSMMRPTAVASLRSIDCSCTGGLIVRSTGTRGRDAGSTLHTAQRGSEGRKEDLRSLDHAEVIAVERVDRRVRQGTGERELLVGRDQLVAEVNHARGGNVDPADP